MTEFDRRDTISSRPGLQELGGVYREEMSGEYQGAKLPNDSSSGSRAANGGAGRMVY
jgi:hypothetical protein